jgi:hypothetical protein
MEPEEIWLLSTIELLRDVDAVESMNPTPKVPTVSAN